MEMIRFQPICRNIDHNRNGLRERILYWPTVWNDAEVDGHRDYKKEDNAPFGGSKADMQSEWKMMIVHDLKMMQKDMYSTYHSIRTYHGTLKTETQKMDLFEYEYHSLECDLQRAQ